MRIVPSCCRTQWLVLAPMFGRECVVFTGDLFACCTYASEHGWR